MPKIVKSKSKACETAGCFKPGFDSPLVKACQEIQLASKRNRVVRKAVADLLSGIVNTGSVCSPEVATLVKILKETGGYPTDEEQAYATTSSTPLSPTLCTWQCLLPGKALLTMKAIAEIIDTCDIRAEKNQLCVDFQAQVVCLDAVTGRGELVNLVRRCVWVLVFLRLLKDDAADAPMPQGILYSSMVPATNGEVDSFSLHSSPLACISKLRLRACSWSTTVGFSYYNMHGGRVQDDGTVHCTFSVRILPGDDVARLFSFMSPVLVEFAKSHAHEDLKSPIMYDEALFMKLLPFTM